MPATARPHKPMNGILTGALLTLGFAGLAALLSTLITAPALQLLVNAVAFLAVGWATLRLRPNARPVEPAIGAVAALLTLGLVQLVLAEEVRAELGWRVIVTSLAISVLLAFSLAWLGARLATRERRQLAAPGEGARWPRTHRAPGSERDPLRAPPESRPAPHSG